MNDQIRDAFDRLMVEVKEPPAWEQVTTSPVVPLVRRPLPRHRGAWAAATGFVVVVVGVVAAAILIRPADVAIPGLEWRHVETPPGVDVVFDLWSLREGGYAIRSDDGIWTSVDGESWTRAASVPAEIFSPDYDTSVIDYGDRWIGIGNTGDGPFVSVSLDGEEWATTPLPTPPDSGDDLVTPDTIAVQLVANNQGVVVVGRTLVVPDIDAVVARFAPELVGQDFTSFVDMNAGFVQITTPGGEDDISIPVEDIDARLAVNYPMSTLVWHSEDVSQWTQVHTIDEYLPGVLAASTDGFALKLSPFGIPKQLWTSPDGVAWVLASGETPISTNLVSFKGEWYNTQQRSVLRLGSDGTWETTLNTEDPAAPSNSPLGLLEAGPFGLVAVSYNSSTGDTPVEQLWFSSDGVRWSDQHLEDVFGSKGTVLVTVGTDRVVVGHDPNGQAFTELRAPFDFWMGTLAETQDGG